MWRDVGERRCSVVEKRWARRAQRDSGATSDNGLAEEEKKNGKGGKKKAETYTRPVSARGPGWLEMMADSDLPS